MPAPFLEQVGDIKRELVEFVLKGPLRALLAQERKRRFGDRQDLKDNEWINLVDEFCFEFPLPDGSLAVERFVESRPDLSEQDREILLGMRGVFEALLEVKKLVQDGCLCYNWFNKKEYLVKATKEPKTGFHPGMVLAVRLVPVLDFHVLSGAQSYWLNMRRDEILRLVKTVVLKKPSVLLIDNEERIRKGFELQEADYNEFVEYFGAEEIVGTGREVVQKDREWRRWQNFAKIREDERTRAQMWEKKHGRPYVMPEMKLPDAFLENEDIGYLHHKKYGIVILQGYGQFISIFKNPDEKAVRSNRDILEGYIRSPDIHPMVLARAAERYPEAFRKVMRILFKQTDFRLPDDLDALLRRYKRKTLMTMEYPSIVTVDDDLWTQ